MVDETSPSDVELMFPPLFKLPNLEYQVIVEDLGLLSFTPDCRENYQVEEYMVFHILMSIYQMDLYLPFESVEGYIK